MQKHIMKLDIVAQWYVCLSNMGNGCCRGVDDINFVSINVLVCAVYTREQVMYKSGKHTIYQLITQKHKCT